MHCASVLWLHSLQVMCPLRCRRCLSTESRSDTWHSMLSYWVTVMSSSLSYASDWVGPGTVWTILRYLVWREVFHHLRNVQKSLRVKYQELLMVFRWDASEDMAHDSCNNKLTEKYTPNHLLTFLKPNNQTIKHIVSILDSTKCTKWRKKCSTRYGRSCDCRWEQWLWRD